VGSSTTKKVVIRRFDREPLQGFVNQQTYLQAEGVELLLPVGSVMVIPYEQIRNVCFVRDFDLFESGPERKQFATRPKMNGLWVRMQLRDGEVLDGILSNDLLQISPLGFNVVPPDSSANNQKMFVPRAALQKMDVLGVVGSPLTKPKRPSKESDAQFGLFEEPS
jgi:hypothetical protein